MFEQERHPETPPRPAASRRGGAEILKWLDSWREVREEILQLLADHERAAGGHSTTSFEPLIAETDEALRLLRHRIEWLQSHHRPAD